MCVCLLQNCTKMKELAHKQTRNPPTNTAPSTLSMHKASQAIISKPKPKIRIIHIFAPEIIKTDAANFRELVQRLTGKPTDHRHCRQEEENPNKKSTRTIKRKIVKEPNSRFIGSNKKMELAVRAGFHAAAGPRQRTLTGSEQVFATWDRERDSEDHGCFLGGFVDHHQFDGGFMQEINHQFPFLEGTTDHDMDAYAELQLA